MTNYNERRIVKDTKIEYLKIEEFNVWNQKSKKGHSLSLVFIVSISLVFIILYVLQAFFLTKKISNTIRSDYEQNIQELTATHALALERKIKEYRRNTHVYGK